MGHISGKNPRYNTGRSRITNTIQCGGRQCGSPLAISEGGGQGGHTIHTRTRGGTDLGSFLCILWDPGLTGTRMTTRSSKHPNWNVLT